MHNKVASCDTHKRPTFSGSDPLLEHARIDIMTFMSFIRNGGPAVLTYIGITRAKNRRDLVRWTPNLDNDVTRVYLGVVLVLKKTVVCVLSSPRCSRTDLLRCVCD